nr:MAG TPA: hypothetical protein [Caudoviricetes sp.]
MHSSELYICKVYILDYITNVKYNNTIVIYLLNNTIVIF